MTTLKLWAKRQRPRVNRLTAGVQVRNPDARRREFESATNLGALFIENVKYKPTLHARVRPYDALGSKQPAEVLDDALSIGLRTVADSAPLQTTLQKALFTRVSKRDHNGESMTIEELSYLLELGAGLNPESDPASLRRTYPSGGKLYPCEIFCIAQRIEPVPKAVYRYDPAGHRMYRHVDFTVDKERELARYFSPAAALVLLLVIDIEAMLLRYEELAYKLSLLEAGHMAQNFVLIGAALELRSSTLCYFPDDSVNDLLRADGRRKFVCYAIEFGR